MGTEQFEEDEEITLTMTLEDGSEMELRVITVFDMNDRSYVALEPLEGPDAGQGMVYLYRYTEVDGEPSIDNITDDDEYEDALDAFDEYLDELDFEALSGDDEE